jgi:DNA-binding NarL/FixJ family response regulator
VDIEEIHQRWPSTTWDEAKWFEVLEERPDIYEALLDAMARVRVDTKAARQVWHSMRNRHRPRAPQPPRRYPPKKRVLHGLAYGLDIGGLALTLKLSDETVKTHLAQLRAEYGVPRSCGLVAAAIRELDPDLPPLPAPPVSPAAHEVLIGTARGLPQAEIASRTDRSWKTVKSWRGHLYGTFDVRHEIALAAAGFATGLVKATSQSVIGRRNGRPWCGRLSPS